MTLQRTIWCRRAMNKIRVPHPWIRERAKLGPARTKHEGLGFNGRLAVFATEKFGSMGAFYVLVVWMFGWMALASLGFSGFRNDPYPFDFLLFPEQPGSTVRPAHPGGRPAG